MKLNYTETIQSYTEVNGWRVFPDGYKQKIVNNKLHNLDGPAEVFPDGEGHYWIENEQFSKEDWEILRC